MQAGFAALVSGSVRQKNAQKYAQPLILNSEESCIALIIIDLLYSAASLSRSTLSTLNKTYSCLYSRTYASLSRSSQPSGYVLRRIVLLYLRVCHPVPYANERVAGTMVEIMRLLHRPTRTDTVLRTACAKARARAQGTHSSVCSCNQNSHRCSDLGASSSCCIIELEMWPFVLNRHRQHSPIPGTRRTPFHSVHRLVLSGCIRCYSGHHR
jgi:hypothetical protein